MSDRARPTEKDISLVFQPLQEGGGFPGIELSGWDGLQITRGIDTGANGFAFSMPWTPDRDMGGGYRMSDMFVPYRSDRVVAKLGGEPILDGFIEDHSFAFDAGSKTLEIQGRSTTGRLVDSSAGGPDIGFEFAGGQSFTAVAQRVARGPLEWIRNNPNSERGFVTIRANPDITVPPSEISPGDTIYDFLSSLAAAQGLYAIPLVTERGFGYLQFTRLSSTRRPVADLIEDESPLVRCRTKHDVTQRFYTHTVIDTEENNHATSEDRGLPGWIRWRSIKEPRQSSADLSQAARMLRSRSIIDSYSVSATVTGWEHDDDVWNAGDIVRIHAPSVAIYSPSPLIIKRATLQFDENGGRQTRLDLALPELYDNQEVTTRPWLV